MAAEPPAAYVYIRKGGTIIPLSPLYSGLYKVLSSGPKILKLVTGKSQSPLTA
jgi:hypothetical protein